MFLFIISTIVFFVLWMVKMIQYADLDAQLLYMDGFLIANHYYDLDDNYIENLPGKYVMVDSAGVIDYDAELNLLMTRSHDRVGVVVYFPGS